MLYLYVTCTGTPSPVTNVATNIHLNGILISWDHVTSDPVCGSVSYDVTISSSDGVIMTVTTYGTSYSFTGLTPDTSYTVTVAGRNDAGVGESGILTVITLSHSPTRKCSVCMYVLITVCT